MHVDHGFRVVACLEERVPFAGVNGWQAKEVRDFGEAHCVHAACSVAVDLGSGEFGIPHRNDDERNETTLAGAATPFFNHEVVIGLHAKQREFLVLCFSEGLPAETREGWEAQGRFGVVCVHVGKSCCLIPASLAHFFIGDRKHRALFGIEANSGDDATHWNLEVLVAPEVGELSTRAVVANDVERVVHAIELEVVDAQALEARTNVEVLLGEAAGPDIGRFDDVIIDRNDLRDDALCVGRSWIGSGDGHGSPRGRRYRG